MTRFARSSRLLCAGSLASALFGCGSQDSTPPPYQPFVPAESGLDATTSTQAGDAAPSLEDAQTAALDGSSGAVPEDVDASHGHEDAGSQGAPAGPHDAGALQAPGDGGVVHATIVVGAGETFDGEGKRYVAGSELGDGSQDEGQKPVFKLEDGASLRNVVLGAPAADGIHTYGDVTLENIVWEDIGEDALTIKEEGTVVLDGGSATNGADKVFQINAPSTFRVSNFTASHAGKFIRQNGGSEFEVQVYIDHCDISAMDEAIFRTDSDVSSVTMTNTRYSAIGEELFMGVNPDNVTLANNSEY